MSNILSKCKRKHLTSSLNFVVWTFWACAQASANSSLELPTTDEVILYSMLLALQQMAD